MLKNLFTRSEKIEYSFNSFKVYTTSFNGKDSSKLSSPTVINTGKLAEILLKIKTLENPNLAPIYRITDHSIFTKRLFAYSKTSVNLSKEYKKYFFCKIKAILEFLHENKIFHNSLNVDHFFIDECGNPILGNYFGLKYIEENSDNSTTFVDLLALDRICQNELKISLNKLKIPNFFLNFEIKIKEFLSFTVEEKIEFFDEIKRNKLLINNFMIDNIFCLLMKELNDEKYQKEYKISILNFFIVIDEKILESKYALLLKIIDSNVRLFLLSHLNINEPLDNCLDDIALGIRANDKILRFETLTFIFKNEKNFSKKSMDKLLSLMGLFITDNDSISYICNYFINSNTVNYKHLYKVLYSFLTLKKSVKDVYNCIEKYCGHFNKRKLCSELLPLLCSRLSDKESQDQCFRLVEGIVQDLKKNKSLLEHKDWGLSKVAGIFKKSTSKSLDEDAIIKNKIKEITENNAVTFEEWEEQDL